MSGAPTLPTQAILRRCAAHLREYAVRPQPTGGIGIPASAGPAAWHAARQPHIPKAELLALAAEAEAEAVEIEQLRALVTRLTNVAATLAGELTDPGTEALAAIHCGRHFIYG